MGGKLEKILLYILNLYLTLKHIGDDQNKRKVRENSSEPNKKQKTSETFLMYYPEEKCRLNGIEEVRISLTPFKQNSLVFQHSQNYLADNNYSLAELPVSDSESNSSSNYTEDRLVFEDFELLECGFNDFFDQDFGVESRYGDDFQPIMQGNN